MSVAEAMARLHKSIAARAESAARNLLRQQPIPAAALRPAASAGTLLPPSQHHQPRQPETKELQTIDQL
eukprot:COSAG05_NODE_9990_length_589_cov_1.026531_2_plen_68_part_01